MPLTITYPGPYTANNHIFRATGGGVNFSANLAGAVFDYFTDTAVVNDAIYFSGPSSSMAFSNLRVNVGTAIAGTGITGVWEYRSNDNLWETCHNLTDPTNGFTLTGANTIVFPVQGGMTIFTLNGITDRAWIRYRLTAVTTITEGGANQTTAPTSALGVLEVSGTDDTTPATFKNLFDWVIINAPEIGATNPAPSIFIFNNCKIKISSRLKSTNEQIFIGNGGFAYPNDFSFIESGLKVGVDGWSDGSCIFICNIANTSAITTSSSTKMYGVTLGKFTNLINGRNRTFSSFLSMTNGEWIGCQILDKTGYFGVITSNKCVVPGGLITSTFPGNYPANLTISSPGYYIWFIYGSSGTIRGVKYAMPTQAIFYANQSGMDNSIINLINPSPSLPEQTGTVKVIGRNLGNLVNLTKCFFYDDSAGTFTDYTTASQDTTINDVPLSGDVGDCFYFNASGWASNMCLMFQFTITQQTNDYVYVWEKWANTPSPTGWKTMPVIYNIDNTNNLSNSGTLYFNNQNLVSTTINGTAGFWIRLKIVAKGTGSPVCSRIQYKNQSYAGEWKIYEKMTTQFKVVDENGNAIQNASLKLVAANAIETSLTTDANGETINNETIISTTQFDQTVSDADFNVRKISSNPFTLTVSKPGYETYEKIGTITGPLYEVISIKKVVKLRKTIDGKLLAAVKPETGSSAKLIEL